MCLDHFLACLRFVDTAQLAALNQPHITCPLVGRFAYQEENVEDDEQYSGALPAEIQFGAHLLRLRVLLTQKSPCHDQWSELAGEGRIITRCKSCLKLASGAPTGRAAPPVT